MKDLEFNKIFAAILLAGIIAMFSGFISELFIPDHDLEKDAVAIEGIESAGGASAKEVLAEPILAMITEAEIARGQKISKACAACHSFDKGGANGVGPNLWDIVGKAKQGQSGYNYSGALIAHGNPKWEYIDLNEYLYKPKKYAPGTNMNFIGLKKPEDRAAIVAYLRSLSDSPVPLPTDAQIAAEEAKLAPPEAEGDEAEGEESSEETPNSDTTDTEISE